ncbi:transcriptional regulator, ArsR family [Caloramator quimbayensis]|uniref:Transcriptional regulator, ArsR family n=1 Tax=Caloramator quimbayensis TaxID=1147123 RepID=A0A1T4YBH8_9CLOT|nr:metalloregulator ArsR/SmtB family transcription factor [Caloramator quimbayensis]SKA98868.1 transcriptional regulator, ArsR family [Caloramator quimbayensis]
MELLPIIKALSDETRLRILNLLKFGDLCVCEIEVLLDINQSNASRHLNKLTNAKLVEYYKVNKYVYYKIKEDILKEHPFVKEIIDSEIINLKVCESDLTKLKKYKQSGLSCDDLKEGKICLN